MSQGSRATKIFRLPLKLSILWPRVVRDFLTTPRPDRLGLRWLFQDGPLPANAASTSLRGAIPCLRYRPSFPTIGSVPSSSFLAHGSDGQSQPQTLGAVAFESKWRRSNI